MPTREVGGMLTCVALILIVGISCSSKDPVQAALTPKPDNPTDFFVSAQSGDDTNSGKRSAPFKTIQPAIDAAEATMRASNATGIAPSADHFRALKMLNATKTYSGGRRKKARKKVGYGGFEPRKRRKKATRKVSKKR